MTTRQSDGEAGSGARRNPIGASLASDGLTMVLRRQPLDVPGLICVGKS
jgi:hypothetical protein